MSDMSNRWPDDLQQEDSHRAPAPAHRGARTMMSTAELRAERDAFSAWIDSAQTRQSLKLAYPEEETFDRFLGAVKAAVASRPSLLIPTNRPSLCAAIEKAAWQGLRPDGKEGALLDRWDSEAGRRVVVWQPMVWGIVKLGRLTGSIKTIRAVIAFRGEPFEIRQGDKNEIHHVVDLDVQEQAYKALNPEDRNGANPAAFFDLVQAAYCIITAPDGTQTKRYMTRGRLDSLRQASKAKGGPWHGPFVDEMILKAVIHYTAKWVDLDYGRDETRRFASAILTDLEADFRAEAGQTDTRSPSLTRGGKLDAIEATIPRPEKTDGEADRRRRWVTEQVEMITRAQTAEEVLGLVAGEDYRRRYDILRSENSDLASRLEKAVADKLQQLGPPDEDEDEGDAT